MKKTNKIKIRGCDFHIDDRPIKDDWDMLEAISGAKNNVFAALDLCRSIQDYRDIRRVIDATFENLRSLTDDYLHSKNHSDES